MIMIKRVELYAAVLTTALVVCLHLTRLRHAGGLWRDEAGACQVALMPSLHGITKVFQHEAFPLLFPLTVRAYTFFAGASDLALRLLGFLVGLSIVVVLWINARILSRSVPLLSLALLGINTSVIRWADSLRGYGMGTVFILITFGLYWRIVTSPSVWVAGLAAIAAICSVQTLYSNAVMLLAIGTAGAAVAIRRHYWGRALVVLGISGLAALTLIPYVPSLQSAKAWSVVITIPEFSLSLFWAKLSAALSSARPGVCWLWVLLIAFAVIAGVIVQFCSLSSQEGHRQDAGLYCLIVLLVSIPAYFGFLKILSYPTKPWYYVALMGLIAVAVEGAVLAAAWQWWRGVARILVVSGLAIWSFVPTWNELHFRQTNLDLIATKLSHTAGAGDMILVVPWYFGITFHRYYNSSTPWTTLPPIDDHKMHRYDLLKTQMAATNPIGPVLEAMSAALRSGNQVWIVGSLPFPAAREAPPPLAPAPYESVGWDQDTYVESWSMQSAHFLQAHAVSAQEVPISDDQLIDPYENVGLMVVRGWQQKVP